MPGGICNRRKVCTFIHTSIHTYSTPDLAMSIQYCAYPTATAGDASKQAIKQGKARERKERKGKERKGKQREAKQSKREKQRGGQADKQTSNQAIKPASKQASKQSKASL